MKNDLLISANIYVHKAKKKICMITILTFAEGHIVIIGIYNVPFCYAFHIPYILSQHNQPTLVLSLMSSQIHSQSNLWPKSPFMCKIVLFFNQKLQML